MPLNFVFTVALAVSFSSLADANAAVADAHSALHGVNCTLNGTPITSANVSSDGFIYIYTPPVISHTLFGTSYIDHRQLRRYYRVGLSRVSNNIRIDFSYWELGHGRPFHRLQGASSITVASLRGVSVSTHLPATGNYSGSLNCAP